MARNRQRADREQTTLAELATKRAALTVNPIFEIPVGEDGPPTEFRILASGLNDTEKGTFLFDGQAATDVMAFWASKKGIELAFDYEHQALADPPVEAPAAAWWTPQIRNGELWATNVRWNARAAAYLAAKEYRYFSPALGFDSKTMRVQFVRNVALTNLPAMNGIEPLMAASATTQGDPAMDYEKLYTELKALCEKLSEENKAMAADKEKLSAELTALKAKAEPKGEPDGDEGKDDEELTAAVGLTAGASRTERLSAVRAAGALHGEVLKLTGETSAAGALGKLSAWKSDAADVAKLRSEKETLEASTLATELANTFDQAAKDGKVPPAEDHPIHKSLRTAVLAMGGGKPSREGVDWLKGHVAGLTAMVKGGTGAPEPEMAVTAQQAEINKRAGIDPVAFAKWQAEKLSAGQR